MERCGENSELAPAQQPAASHMHTDRQKRVRFISKISDTFISAKHCDVHSASYTWLQHYSGDSKPASCTRLQRYGGDGQSVKNVGWMDITQS